MIYSLNLPAISDEVAAKLLAEANALYANKDFVNNWAKQRPYPFTDAQLEQENVVSRVGGYIEDVTELQALIGEALPYTFDYEFFIMKNIRPGSEAVSVPSKDFARSIALNLYLQPGRIDFFLNESINNEKKIYDLELPVTSSYPVAANTWYVYDATTVMRTAGIDDMIVMISLVLDDPTITFDQMMKEHPELFGDKLTPSFKA